MIAIALDLGTTTVKAALLSQYGELCSIISRPAPKITINRDSYESDALHYAETVEQVLTQCLTNTDSALPLGLCSQRSSFLIWDKANGEPVTPLISWQDSRGKYFQDQTGTAATLIPALTGLRLTPYYFAPKLSVLLQAHSQWRKRLMSGEWLVGTLDTFLIWRWTNGAHYVTDASMAARTLLMDIHQQHWSADLGNLFDIPLSILPQIRPSTGLGLSMDCGFKLQASVGDQSAALYASVMDDSSKALVNLGTGGFVIRYLNGDTKLLNGYLQTLVFQDQQHGAYMAIEGTLNSIAAALAAYPFRDSVIGDFATSDILALAEPSGLGAPYFSDQFGLYFSETVDGLTSKQIAILLLEAIVFRVVRILEDFHHQSPLSCVYLSGGLSELSSLQQGIAQCAPVPVMVLQQKETSLFGAALLSSRIQSPLLIDTQKIARDRPNAALIKKYQRWKDWLDGLLKKPIMY